MYLPPAQHCIKKGQQEGGWGLGGQSGKGPEGENTRRQEHGGESKHEEDTVKEEVIEIRFLDAGIGMQDAQMSHLRA